MSNWFERAMASAQCDIKELPTWLRRKGDPVSDHETAARIAEPEELKKTIRAAIRVLPCGAHYCRYCPAGSRNGWAHSPSCPYEESYREKAEAEAAVDTLLAQLQAAQARIEELEARLDRSYRQAGRPSTMLAEDA